MNAPPARVYVSGAADAPSVGITMFDLQHGPAGPSLEVRARSTDVERPTYVAAHPGGTMLYAVSEVDDGEIVSVALDDDRLVVQQRVPSGGDGPCHVSTDGRTLVVANYGSGSAAAYALATDGRIGELVWTAQHHGDGPHWRQDRPHAHCAVLDPRRASVWVVDLGTDHLVRYDADTAGFRRAKEVSVAAGAGPRHLAFHPRGTIAFVICELDNTVAVLDTVATDPVVRGTVSTLPDGATGESLAAAIVVHPDGDRVFASNRGHDSIAVFAVEHGSLRPLGHVPSGGAGPRDITLDPSGSLLLAANQRSGEVVGFDVSGPGLPRPWGVLAEVDEPTCVVISEVGT